MTTRIEKDTMGEMHVPEDALFGAQTARAVENFPISGYNIGRDMIHALGLVKKAAAMVNHDLGKLEDNILDAIVAAADQVIEGELDAHFPVDVFQTGSGTSSNMNTNEVIANRAIEHLGGQVGSKDPVHPNDHVNMGQSSNDVFPTAIHIAALSNIESNLLPALDTLQDELKDKAKEWDDIVKIGRTHLQDATPIRLGQEFSGFAGQIKKNTKHLRKTSKSLRELPIGGTAVGTGLNTHKEFGKRMAKTLGHLTELPFEEAENHFEAHAARDAAVRTSGALKALAVSLIKIANDIRLLGSGPRLGLGELHLPEVQPGSSIMPGKVNPVITESMIQVCAQVIGNDTTISISGFYSQFQLNTMQPLIAMNLLEQINLLSNAVRVFTEKLIVGLEPNRKNIESKVEQSLSLATPLAPHVGYDKAAAIAKRAAAEDKTVREVATEEGIMEKDELGKLLDPISQTKPDVD